METSLKNDSWVWVIVQDPEQNAQILCQQDNKTNIKFIPVFYEKDHALMCMNFFAKEPGKKYEPNAIIVEDLVQQAKTNHFSVFILNEKGEVKESINLE